MKITLFTTLLIFNSCLFSATENRIALVIGNANYPDLGKLDNPINDANDMEVALKKLGFTTIIKGLDLSKKEMIAKISQFDKKIREGNEEDTVGLIYYAGHGLEVNGINYLVPINSKMRYKEDVETKAISLDKVIKRLNYTKSRMKIIILDACRDSPLDNRPTNGVRTTRTAEWSVVNQKAKGLFIAFGTAPGRKAADGVGRNGLFTKHILKNISVPNLSIDEVFNNVREGVLSDSHNKQMTWQNSAIVGSGKFYFSPKNSRQQNRNQYSTNHSTSTLLQKECINCPNMIAIPSGSFQMGSNSGAEDEKPIHKVTIQKFHMSETEITFKQWDQCVLERQCEHKPKDKGWGRGQHPVINVSWNDTQQYIKWLRMKTGNSYRLPSESEWEYAAKKGGNNNEINCSNTWFGQYSGDCGDKKQSIRVKTFNANKFGLYDMHGNVWEWLQDCKVENYINAPNNGKSRLDGDCSYRILRGASFFENKNWQTSTTRGWNKATIRKSNFGFRVVFDSLSN